MTARGYELDEAVRRLSEAVRRLDLKTARVKLQAASNTTTEPGTTGIPGAPTDVEGALAAMQGEIEAHLADTADAHDASATSYDPSTSGSPESDVQGELDRLEAGVAAAVAGAISNPMSAPADLIVGGVGGVPARLAKGSDGQVLSVNPTTHLLAWLTLTGGVVDILDLPTAEMDASLVLAPDGVGGVEFRAEAGGGGSPVATAAALLYAYTHLR